MTLAQRGVAFGDFDNDGFIDVWSTNLDGKPTILKNDGGSHNTWVAIKLMGAAKTGRHRCARPGPARLTNG